MAKVLIIAGYASSLYNFRGPLIKELLKQHDVVATAPFDSDDVSRNIEALGIEFYPNTFDRTGMNPLKDLKSRKELQNLIKEISPDIALAYTIKPVVYGLRAAQKAGVHQTYALITGLGSGFDNNTPKQKTLSKIVKKLYDHALKKATGVIFQNPDDKDFFIKNSIIDKQKRALIVNGSGVDLKHYTGADQSERHLTFLLVARMVREKGVELFVNVARVIKREHPNINFELLGWVDENPNSLSQSQLESWQEEGIITYHGSTADVRPYVQKASVFVLPTFYREGTPRTILEAMAMKKAIITTDTPGCRETVVDGLNGFLIPPKDKEALFDRVMHFVKNPEDVRKMGLASFEIAKEKYDVKKVNAELIGFMNLS